VEEGNEVGGGGGEDDEGDAGVAEEAKGGERERS
jgi:hypothetical protein